VRRPTGASSGPLASGACQCTSAFGLRRPLMHNVRPPMIGDRWHCTNCRYLNVSDVSSCISCGCPANISQSSVDLYRRLLAAGQSPEQARTKLAERDARRPWVLTKDRFRIFFVLVLVTAIAPVGHWVVSNWDVPGQIVSAALLYGVAYGLRIAVYLPILNRLPD
jgi:hypothetical protein